MSNKRPERHPPQPHTLGILGLEEKRDRLTEHSHSWSPEFRLEQDLGKWLPGEGPELARKECCEPRASPTVIVVVTRP